jgi:hypothetical protein
MRLGLLADVHEQVQFLGLALDRFGRVAVDRVVVLGDMFETGQRIEETCRLLAKAKAVGVWGNHDYGLCCKPSDEIRARFSASTVGFMASLQPRLELDGCYFCHVEPWLDPENLMDLWFYEGPPEDDARLARIFDAVANRLIFAGHYHRWLLATPGGITDWQGDCPIKLDRGRFFVVVGALLEGRYAIFDTDTSELVPLTC